MALTEGEIRGGEANHLCSQSNRDYQDLSWRLVLARERKPFRVFVRVSREQTVRAGVLVRSSCTRMPENLFSDFYTNAPDDRVGPMGFFVGNNEKNTRIRTQLEYLHRTGSVCVRGGLAAGGPSNEVLLNGKVALSRVRVRMGCRTLPTEAKRKRSPRRVRLLSWERNLRPSFKGV